MSYISSVLTAALAAYALVMAVFIITENRRPQATLAWMLALIFAAGVLFLRQAAQSVQQGERASEAEP